MFSNYNMRGRNRETVTFAINCLPVCGLPSLSAITSFSKQHGYSLVKDITLSFPLLNCSAEAKKKLLCIWKKKKVHSKGQKCNLSC